MIAKFHFAIILWAMISLA